LIAGPVLGRQIFARGPVAKEFFQDIQRVAIIEQHKLK
jgi:hypothetical protein